MKGHILGKVKSVQGAEVCAIRLRGQRSLTCVGEAVTLHTAGQLNGFLFKLAHVSKTTKHYIWVPFRIGDASTYYEGPRETWDSVR